MISGLTAIVGKVTKVDEEKVIITTASFVFSVVPSTELLLSANDEKKEVPVRLLMREPSIEIFGFATHDEARFFDELVKVSGVGPRSAMSILSSAPLSTTVGAITRGDATAIARAPGVGKKSAQKIVLELQDKLPSFLSEKSDTTDDQDIADALVSLGYTAEQARKAISLVPEETETKEDRLRAALRSLSN